MVAFDCMDGLTNHHLVPQPKMRGRNVAHAQRTRTELGVVYAQKRTTSSEENNISLVRSNNTYHRLASDITAANAKKIKLKHTYTLHFLNHTLRMLYYNNFIVLIFCPLSFHLC